MTWPVKGAPVGALGKWNTPRPLGGPYTHNHGAVDLEAGVGASILAPESGLLYGFMLWRPSGDSRSWTKGLVRPFPWGGYTYDLYGGVLVLAAHTGDRVHLMCHLYMNQLLKYASLKRGSWEYSEEANKARWPMFLWHTFGESVNVEEGQPIGVVGDAGDSKGPHLHWEIHQGWTWTTYEERPDPEVLVPRGGRS